MLPQDVLSTNPQPAGFIPPRNGVYEPLECFELGGVAINDGSQGLQVYTWRGRYIGGDIVLDVPDVVAPQSVLTVADVTEFQFTFDQNMQPVITYMVSDTDAYYYWFDPTVPEFVTDQLAAGSFTPRCSLDDKRALSGTTAGGSDVIITYMRGTTLYFRQQRDRYDTEYVLETGLDGYKLGQIGMNEKLRFQFQLVPEEPE